MAGQTIEQQRDGLVVLLERIAEDIGRLRTHSSYAGSLEHTVDRIAAACESAWWLLQPTAADLYADHTVVGYTDTEASSYALEAVDKAADRLLRVLRDDLREDRRVAALHELRSVA